MPFRDDVPNDRIPVEATTPSGFGTKGRSNSPDRFALEENADDSGKAGSWYRHSGLNSIESCAEFGMIFIMPTPGLCQPEFTG
jgi:hypothetical protein